MEKELSDLACKEVWHILKKLPLEIVSKIPFDIRNNICEKAEKCDVDVSGIDTTVELKEMNISDEAKDIMSTLYVKYLSDESVRDSLKNFINFCDIMLS